MISKIADDTRRQETKTATAFGPMFSSTTGAEIIGPILNHRITKMTENDSKTISVPWDGKKVSFRPYLNGSLAEEFIAARKRLGSIDTCPLCKRKLRSSVAAAYGIVLVVSTQVGIPNRILCGGCWAERTPECAMKDIADDFEQAQRYKDWFPGETA